MQCKHWECEKETLQDEIKRLRAAAAYSEGTLGNVLEENRRLRLALKRIAYGNESANAQEIATEALD
jgi:hypothetical protein